MSTYIVRKYGILLIALTRYSISVWQYLLLQYYCDFSKIKQWGSTFAESMAYILHLWFMWWYSNSKMHSEKMPCGLPDDYTVPLLKIVWQCDAFDNNVILTKLLWMTITIKGTVWLICSNAKVWQLSSQLYGYILLRNDISNDFMLWYAYFQLAFLIDIYSQFVKCVPQGMQWSNFAWVFTPVLLESSLQGVQ